MTVTSAVPISIDWETTLEIVDPRSGQRAIDKRRVQRAEAPRLATLSGRTIAFINNGVASANILQQALKVALAEKYGVADFVEVFKPSRSVAPTAEEWALVHERADAAITLWGGCGSCSSRSMRDAIELEWNGIPAVSIVHESLVASAEAMCRMSKMDGYEMVVVPYPAQAQFIWEPELLETVVEDILPKVVARLVDASIA